MVDNVTLSVGTVDGETIATDDISGNQYQRIKLTDGTADSTTTIEAGGGTEAGALRVTVASDSTGVLSVDNGGTFATQATLQTNSGVDIGDVDVTSVIPGTGSTNLGKAIDSVAGGTDSGVAMLAKHKEDLVHLTTADNDYDILTLDSLGQLHVNPEGHHVFDTFDVTTGWTALGNDTTNLATTAKHGLGVAALTFDKADGAANTVFAGIQKTISSVDLGDVSPHDLIQGMIYLPVITDVSYVFIRIGTDSSNYNEWRIEDTNLTAVTFEIYALALGDPSHAGITGNGWDSSAITYIAVGVAFDNETDTLAGLIFDELSYHTNQHSSAQINSEVSSSVSSSNVNLQRIGGSITDKGAGNASNGSQRITIATDDVNQAAINTASVAIQAAVEGTLTVQATNLDCQSGGADMATAAGQLADGHNVTVDNASGGAAVNIQDGGNSITIDGTVTANLSATDNAVLDDIAAKLAPNTTNGHSFYLNQDTSAVASVKASAGTLYWLSIQSIDATPVYLNLYNVASGSVTLGTTTPSMQFIVPSQGDANGSGLTINFGQTGIQFGTAITVAAATTFDGLVDPGTNVVITNIGYE